MIRRLRIDSEASVELDEAAQWYEAQRPGLGTEFLEAVEATLERVASRPDTGLIVPDVPSELAVRRYLVKRFPYAIIYTELNDEIRILAFAHARRRPGYWLDR